MATTINSYSVSFGMDASKYVNGAELSRSETRKLIKDIESARTPAENFAREQDRLTKAYKSGAIELGTYNRLLDAQKQKLDSGSSSLGSYFTKIAAGYLSYQVLVSGIHSVIDTTKAFVDHIRETQAAIDETAKAAANLGVSFTDLSSLRFAASEIGGLDAGQVDNNIKKMQITIAKAVEGDTTAIKAFERLGLDAGRLMQQGPVEAVKAISDGMQGLNSQADKLNAATEIFGRSGWEFVSTLEAGRDTIEESVNFHKQWNSLTDAQVLGVEAANDAWGRIGLAVEGISTTLAAELSVPMLVFAEQVLAADVNSRALYDTLSLVVDAVSGLAVAGIFGVNAGVDAIVAIEEKRAELQKQAAQKTIDRTIQQQKLLAQHKFDAEERNRRSLDQHEQQDAHVRLNDEFQKREELQRKHAASMLDNARKHFETERARQMKLRDDVSKGPSSIEAGSAEAAKFMADQINAAIGKDVVGVTDKPTEEELLAEAQKQSELMAASDTKQAEQVELLKKILEKKPEVSRLR